MCAIAGLTASDDQTALARILQKLAHRGPDHIGNWHDPNGSLALGCARLITTDPDPAAHQPLVSPDGRFVLAFNGYIAGHRRKIDDVREDGGVLRSHNDAELVLHLLAQAVSKGEDIARVLAALSGQYALAFWDTLDRRLWLARDPLGIKPLYVAWQGEGQNDLAFASEVMALAEFSSQQPVESTRENYLAHLFVPAPKTGIAGVELLPPGAVLCWQGGKTTRNTITHPARTPCCDHGSTNLITELREKVRLSVSDAMDVDCRLGCLVSGGFDSAGISAMACDVARERGEHMPLAFVMGFNDPARDETKAAQRLCDHLGQELCVVPAPETAPEIYEALVAGLEGVASPFANPSLVLMQHLSERVGRDVRVCLTGDGGDEIFGGYPRYRAAMLYDRYWQHLPSPVRYLAATIGQWVGTRGINRFLQGGRHDAMGAFAVWNNRCILPELGAKLSGASEIRLDDQQKRLLDHMMAFDRDVTLPGNQLVMADRCGMAFGLEYRPPLLGHDVVQIAAMIPASRHLKDGPKSVWRQVIAPYFPDGHLDNPKVGFNPPVADWLLKIGEYLWGDKDQIVRTVFEHTDLKRDQQKACWARAISGGDFDMSLTVWALLVWRVWDMLKTAKSGGNGPPAMVGLSRAVTADIA
jgi:asparagine synthase (glutamine-hydrolysing)